MKIQKTTEALRIVLGEFENKAFEEAITVENDGNNVTFFPAVKGGKLDSFAAISFSSKGYGGKVVVMTQIMLDGRIGTVIVTENNETPGLGTVATNRTKTKSISDFINGKKDTALPPNQILDSFRNKNCSSAPWKIKKDGGEIDSITGATISSLAVTEAVNIAAKAFESEKSKILEKCQTRNRK
jgi:electron transport complex protein RnfG